MKVLLDTDVLLDVLTERRPHYAASAGVLTYVERGKAEGLVAAHAVTTIYYLLARHSNRRKATEAVGLLLDLLDVAAIGGKTIKHALSMGWRDFEDAVTAAAAVGAGASWLITRNIQDFKPLPIRVVTPEEFLSTIS